MSRAVTPPTGERTHEPTPGQTVGPFFGYALPYVGGPDVRAPWQPDAIRLHGTVFDGTGDPIPDAFVEIWGADAAGRASTERGSYPMSLSRLRRSPVEIDVITSPPPPLLVLLALLVGAQFGLGGLILAVPLAVMARVALKELWWDPLERQEFENKRLAAMAAAQGGNPAGAAHVVPDQLGEAAQRVKPEKRMSARKQERRPENIAAESDAAAPEFTEPGESGEPGDAPRRPRRRRRRK